MDLDEKPGGLRAGQARAAGRGARERFREPLFLAFVEAVEEAVYNSLLKATTVTGNGHTVESIPIDRLREILAKRRS